MCGRLLAAAAAVASGGRVPWCGRRGAVGVGGGWSGGGMSMGRAGRDGVVASVWVV